MKHTRTRLLALVLALALLATLALPVIATLVPGDISGDGKITVFDAQLLMEAQAGLRTLNADQQNAADKTNLLDVIKTILGTMPGAVDSDGDGVMEIYTVQGLEYMAKNPNADYQLMSNIDMSGTSWTPVRSFNGSFNGNGHTIRNVSINTDSADTNNSKVMNMGFFGDTKPDAVITDLHLRNVTVTATDSTEYMGLFIGSNRGVINNCTATGTLIDSRETHEKQVYMGAMAGRICTVKDGTPGSLIGGTNLSITDTAGVKTTTGLTANAKVYVNDRDSITLGLVGYKPSNATATGIWADTSNSISQQSEIIQARRTEAVRYMNEMGTVLWTPSETLKYTDAKGNTSTYTKSKVFRGLPYNHKNGSLERFLSVMSGPNSSGVYTTVKGLGNSTIINNEVEGFVMYMGNDCSDAVAQAWQRVSPMIVQDHASHTTPYHGGAFVEHTLVMIPEESVRNKYGIYQVGDWSGFSTIDPTTGKRVSATVDMTEAAYDVPDVGSTKEVLKANGADVIYEAYAKATQGDAIVAYCTEWGDGYTAAGHSRLITADPIVIRKVNGAIDTDASYMITAEQGGGGSSGTGWTSSWRVDYLYSFKTLLDDSADSGSSGYYRTYIPITMRAFHDENIRNSYVAPYTGTDAVSAPNEGKIFSNYRVMSSTVTVKKGDTIIYQGVKFAGVGPTSAESSSKIQTIDLSVHNDDFLAAAEAAGLVVGQTYSYTVEVLLGDGTTHTYCADQPFVYNP